MEQPEHDGTPVQLQVRPPSAECSIAKPRRCCGVTFSASVAENQSCEPPYEVNPVKRTVGSSPTRLVGVMSVHRIPPSSER